MEDGLRGGRSPRRMVSSAAGLLGGREQSLGELSTRRTFSEENGLRRRRRILEEGLQFIVFIHGKTSSGQIERFTQR